MSLPLERRHADRLAVDKPVKVQRASAARFEAARTVNVSASGALIELHSPRAIGAGERLALAIAAQPSVVLKARAFVPARVVRVRGPGAHGSQRIAVEFLRAEHEADTLALAA